MILKNVNIMDSGRNHLIMVKEHFLAMITQNILEIEEKEKSMVKDNKYILQVVST